MPNIIAFPNQVAKVFPCDFGFISSIASLLSFALKLLKVALQVNFEFVTGVLERPSDLRADSEGIGMGVVYCR